MEKNKSIIENFELKNKKTISIGTVYFYTNQLLCVEFKDDILVEIKNVIELADTTKELTGGVIPILSLIVTGERNNISTEAFSYDVHKELNIIQPTIAEAIVIKNLATRIIINFYYKIKRPNYPVKIFDVKEKAILWLLSKNA